MGRSALRLGASSRRTNASTARLSLRRWRREREGGGLRDHGRREGPAALGQHGGPGVLRGGAQAPRGDAGHRAEPAAKDRRRGEEGRDHVRARTPRRACPDARGHSRPRGGRGRLATAGGLVLLDGVPAQHHGRAAGGAHRLLPRGRDDRGGERSRGDQGVRRVLPDARLRDGGESPRLPRKRRARAPGLRSARKHRGGLPDAVGHDHGGDARAGVRCCEEALALSPSPVDAYMAKAARGYGLIKAGEVATGTAELAEAVGWFDRSRLRLTRSSFALYLADGYLRQGERSKAQRVLEEVIATSVEVGYRHFEGIAHRLLGKALAARADLCRAAGDLAAARRLLDHALATFEELGTLDEPLRVRAALTALENAP